MGWEEKTILEVSGLKKYFGEVKAVDGVNFAIKKETITSIIGPNGAGKTTLLNLISGMLKPDAGKVVFMGKNITKMPPYKIAKLGIGRSFQLVSVYDGLTVFDNIRIPILSRMGKTKSMVSLLERDVKVKEEANEILELFGLFDKKDVLAGELPHGDRKLLDVAIAFALNPKLVLLDEPTSGVGVREKRHVMDVIEKAVREKGVTAIIVEHDMDIVFSYSDRIIVMHQGKILADGSPGEIKENEEVKTVILGGEIL